MYLLKYAAPLSSLLWQAFDPLESRHLFRRLTRDSMDPRKDPHQESMTYAANFLQNEVFQLEHIVDL